MWALNNGTHSGRSVPEEARVRGVLSWARPDPPSTHSSTPPWPSGSSRCPSTSPGARASGWTMPVLFMVSLGAAEQAGQGVRQRGGASVCCLTFPSDSLRLCRGPPRLQPLPGSQREPGLPVVQPRPACLSLWATVPTWGRGAAVSNTHHRHGQPPSPSPDLHPQLLPNGPVPLLLPHPSPIRLAVPLTVLASPRSEELPPAGQLVRHAPLQSRCGFGDPMATFLAAD